jgi:hypothetical protein
MADNDSNNKQPWLVPVIVAIVGTVGTVAVAWINKPPQATTPPTAPSPTTPLNQPSSPPIPTLPAKESNPIGWIRVGAIDNTATTFQDNAPLISASENLPVIITPTVVPENGTQVTVVSSVYVRQSFPTPPDYDAKKQKLITSLSPGTRIQVLQKRAFIDPRFPSTMAVWAEVKLP